MADDTDNMSGPFDVQTIKMLVQLMGRHDLSEIDLHKGDQRIRIRRGAQGTTVTAPMAAPVAAAAPSSPAAPAKVEKSSRPLLEIKAPTVGTFYAQEKPDAPPYVSVGSRVTPTTVVCQIEAMKTFNEIPAGCSGVIREVLVENQQPVEYNQVLFRVDPAG